jgi:hypothetical protein
MGVGVGSSQVDQTNSFRLQDQRPYCVQCDLVIWHGERVIQFVACISGAENFPLSWEIPTSS